MRLIPQSMFHEVIKCYPVLAQLPDTLQIKIWREGFPVQGSGGRLAFDYGACCSTFLLVVSGGVRVVKAAGLGREILLYVVRPGDSCILTVSGILGNRPYPACGIWESESQVYGLSAELFQQLIAESPAFRSFIFCSFSERIAHLMDWIDSYLWLPLPNRLARLLLEKGEDTLLHYSHQMLADELGSVREVVSRTLKEFERQGLVQLERMRIHVRNRAALQALAQVGEEDPVGNRISV